MPISQSRRGLAFAASAALAAGVMALPVPAAQAAPVFIDAETTLDPSAYGFANRFAGADDCTYTSTGGTEPTVPVVENGPQATVASSASATFANTSIPGDTATGTSSVTGTGKVTSSGGNVSTIDLAVSASAQVTNAEGTSTECTRRMVAGAELDFRFTVTQPGFLTLTTQNTGGGVFGEVYLELVVPGNNSETLPYVDNYGYGTSFNMTSKMYLLVGTYDGYVLGQSYKGSKSSYAVSGTTTAHAEFHVAGSQTEGVAGKGKKYVNLPAARSCAAHTLAPVVTGKKKRAEQVKQVTFFVNGNRVKKVRTPDKGDVVTLPVADGQTAEVVAEVKLFPAKKGKPGKVLTVGAGYEACS